MSYALRPRGLLAKGASTDELTHAIRDVAAVRRYLGTLLSNRTFRAYLGKAVVTPPDPYRSLINQSVTEMYEVRSSPLLSPDRSP